MHFVFISTLFQPPWGGCEVLWSEAALRARKDGHQVSVFVSERTKLEPQLEKLFRAGGTIGFWKPYHPALNFSQRVFKKILKKGLPEWEWWYRHLPKDADVICLNQGGALCGPMRHGLTEAILAIGKPYVVLARADTGFEYLSDQTRPHVRQFFEGAHAFVSASQSAIDLLRLYLPSKLPNARVLHSPLADYAAAEPRAGDRRSKIEAGVLGSDGGNQLADSEAFWEGHSQAGLQMDSEKLLDTRGANAPATSGQSSASVLISVIRGEESGETKQVPCSATEIAPEAQVIEMACVGRLRVGDKGQHLLLACLAEEPWRSRPYRLSFYGEGPDRKYLEDLVEFYGLEEKIHFAGHTKDVGGIWMRSHLAVQPSFVEGAPQSLLEAMLCRRTCVATAVSGIPEWVEEGRTGFLAAAPTVHHLRLALERAWENRHRWREMGGAARDACLAKRDADPAGSLLGLLCEAAKQPRTDD
jgi:glycosyltransferase involved in cell wall biosynthesis